MSKAVRDVPSIHARIKSDCRHVAPQHRHVGGHADAHCGRCGQCLCCVARGGPPHVVLQFGWYHDGRVWRPTPYHKRRRLIDERALADGLLSAQDRAAARSRLRGNAYGRPATGRDARNGDTGELAQRIGTMRRVDHYQAWANGPGRDAKAVPCVIECPSTGCGAVNVVELTP